MPERDLDQDFLRQREHLLKKAAQNPKLQQAIGLLLDGQKVEIDPNALIEEITLEYGLNGLEIDEVFALAHEEHLNARIVFEIACDNEMYNAAALVLKPNAELESVPDYYDLLNWVQKKYGVSEGQFRRALEVCDVLVRSDLEISHGQA